MTIATRTFTVIVHDAEEGGYWAEVLELPGCVSQGETVEELQKNIREAIEAILYVDQPLCHSETGTGDLNEKGILVDRGSQTRTAA